MSSVKRLVLDVLKPHQPGILDFGKRLAEQADLRVKVTVLEVDEKTETLKIVVEGADIAFDRIQETIADLGASLHSVDEVEVEGTDADSSAS